MCSVTVLCSVQFVQQCAGEGHPEGGGRLLPRLPHALAALGAQAGH